MPDVRLVRYLTQQSSDLNLRSTLGIVRATGFDESSLFFRRTNFCGDVDDEPTRSCSRNMGPGVCVDANGDSFPYCTSNLLLTPTKCQNVATAKRDALGWEYNPNNDLCAVVFDSAKAFTCPKDFTLRAASAIGNTAVFSASGSTSGEECFICEWDKVNPEKREKTGIE